MTKQPYTSGRSRDRSNSSLGRAEHVAEDERPFSEIRKSLLDVLRMLALHRWAFFVPMSLVASVVFILSLYYPRVYRATATFERKNDPVMMNLPMSTGAASFDQYRSTMARDLTSVEYMGDVVENLGLTKDFERLQDGSLTEASLQRRHALARSLAGRLTISTVSPSELLDVTEITYTGPDAELGKRLVEEARRTFILRTKTRIRAHLTDLRKFWIEESESAESALRLARRDETAFRLENPHSDPNNPGGISLKLAQLEMERREMALRRREYESELSALQQMLAATVPTARFEPIGDNGPETSVAAAAPPAVSTDMLRLRDQIHQLDIEIQQLMHGRGMTGEHPEVKALLERRQWLDDEREQWTRRTEASGSTDAPAPMAIPPSAVTVASSDPSMNSDRARFLVQISAQKSKIADMDISLASNAQAIEQIDLAKREVFDKQEEFSEIIQMVAKARKDHTQRTQTVATIDPAINAFDKNKLLLFSEGPSARASFRPISPKASTIVALALLAGIATGALFVVLGEVFDHVYRSSAQVARSLGLPMLESIDEIVTSDDRRYLFLHKMVLCPLIVVCFAGLTGLTASMAYLSIEQPAAYQKLSKIPQAVINLFAVG